MFVSILSFVFDIKLYKRVESRSVHDFGTCKENAAWQCRLPMIFAAKHVFKSEVGDVHRAPRNSFDGFCILIV